MITQVLEILSIFPRIIFFRTKFNRLYTNTQLIYPKLHLSMIICNDISLNSFKQTLYG